MSNNTLKDVISSDYSPVNASSSKNYASKVSPESDLLQSEVNKKPSNNQNRRNGICSNLKSLRISNTNTKDVISSSSCHTSKDTLKSYSIKTKPCYVYLERIKTTTNFSSKSKSSLKLHDIKRSEISGRHNL